MFGNSAAKIGVSMMSGTSDNCECVPRHAFNNEVSIGYVLMDETPYIFLKSLKEDHIFTDKAYIACRGNTSGGTKRIIVRMEYEKYGISDVMFESAGMGLTDQDCELKFAIGGHAVSMDIRKPDAETGVLYYRTLCALAAAQARNHSTLALFKELNGKVKFHITEGSAATVGEALQATHTVNQATAQATLEALAPLSYKHVFQQYLGV
jgi:hypothetical protein